MKWDETALKMICNQWVGSSNLSSGTTLYFPYPEKLKELILENLMDCFFFNYHLFCFLHNSGSVKFPLQIPSLFSLAKFSSST